MQRMPALPMLKVRYSALGAGASARVFNAPYLCQ
jgi:hypothetical protein